GAFGLELGGDEAAFGSGEGALHLAQLDRRDRPDAELLEGYLDVERRQIDVLAFEIDEPEAVFEGLKGVLQAGVEERARLLDHQLAVAQAQGRIFKAPATIEPFKDAPGGGEAVVEPGRARSGEAELPGEIRKGVPRLKADRWKPF